MVPGLYVHVPFCWQKCSYCAFYSVPLASRQDAIANYFEGLRREIWLRQQDAPAGVSSLFIGGGTPTALAAEELEVLLRMLAAGFSELGRLAGIEATSEANPGTITGEKLAILRRYGINRLSLGAQSFSDRLLKEIGRIHNSRDIHEAVQLSRAAGFDNLNLDLIFGLPGQDLQDWQNSIEEALKLEPQHLSLYALSLEEGTPLAERYLGQTEDRLNELNLQNLQGCSETGGPGMAVDRPELAVASLAYLPDEDEQADMYEWAVERLARAGYRRYEISNFALPGKECRHNLEIWRGGDYLGLGPGAVSTVAARRWRNLDNIDAYRERLLRGSLPSAEVEDLAVRERMAERLILGLRLKEGVSLARFRSEFGHDLKDIYQDVLEKYLRQQLVVIEDDCLRLNPRYVFTANAILQGFV